MLTSRRAVLRTTAWAVPAVSVATAAPAFAASPGAAALAFANFDVTPKYGTDPSGYYYDVDINNITVAATGTAAPQPVTLSIAFTVDGGLDAGDPYANSIVEWKVPAGWTSIGSPIAGTLEVFAPLQWRSVATVSSVAPVTLGPVPGAFGTVIYNVIGVFAVTASAPGYGSVVQTFRVGSVTAGKAARTPGADAAASIRGVKRQR